MRKERDLRRKLCGCEFRRDGQAPRQPKVAAIVPMTDHSERIPGKNGRDLAGRPLWCWIFEALSKAETVSEIWIDTDSEVIAHAAVEKFGARLVPSPGNVATARESMNQVLAHDIAQIEADVYLQTHSTNPFLKPETIDAAVRDFLAYPATDSVLSVTRHRKRFWRSGAEPVNHDPARLERTQDLVGLFEENSCLYLFTRESFEATGNRIGRSPALFEIPADEALDIDEISDLQLARALRDATLEAVLEETRV